MFLSDLLVWIWLYLKNIWGVAMKIFMIFLGFIFILINQNLKAEIKPYQSIDNSGLNKQERIEVIDKYLVDLVASLKSMENKLDENSKKVKSLEEVVKALKNAELIKPAPPVSEKKNSSVVAAVDLKEVEKLKADLLTLKNQDI